MKAVLNQSLLVSGVCDISNNRFMITMTTETSKIIGIEIPAMIFMIGYTVNFLMKGRILRAVKIKITIANVIDIKSHREPYRYNEAPKIATT